MKKFTKIITTVSVALMLSSTFASAAMKGSKHDIGGAEGGNEGDDQRICVYCHTPHGASLVDGAPLWNKVLPSGEGFTMYGTTYAGNNPEATVSGPSLVCLSCHDGVNAVNSVVNMPGRAGYNVDGTIMGAAVRMTVSPVLTVANDGLTNDHPISIIYDETAASLRPKTTVLANIEGAPPADWGNYTTIQNLLRSDRVECGSCHDPHRAENGTFLRIKNTGSALCLTCHDK